ncbi:MULTISPECIES: DUF1778 domain-containing protein [Pseudomonas]|uniref:type II toxin-antitoxin system TacA family antitoxin n=1 Tax=Pseudomonas TaxID=286 RepID=UPI0018E6863B|nr:MULTISPECIES: DUF1778 domain-containing protein [Pseudomonas]MBI6919377.1 DUF1778 domain-containing protein [Pseudomonas monteilii]MCE0938310.1 DUF1778 domain-containing protein [Pseudomonas kurunegalensis]MCJ7854043.1 DUF1778 domain-containing protein [Pseudomonas monteilii]WJD64369.1 DUF1778 domain-containing protein [Pseudomonas kurunegalensis]
MSAQINEREKPVPINMRVDTRKRSLIDAAVELLGTDRTSFIVDAACRRAEEVIMDRQLFLLSDEAFDRFEQALEQNPLKDNKCLQKLMSKPAPWS